MRIKWEKIWSKAGNYHEYGTPEERSNFIAGLAHCLDGVFGNYYNIAVVKSEFVTNVSHFSLHPDYKGNKIVKPLEDFLAQYVMPEMQTYIDNHPQRDQIKEKIVENDTSYSTALINAATVLQLQYVAPILILFAVMYAFIDWSMVNAVLGGTTNQ